jgi:heme/copper-type cytochrome/quinol oxidase subunit 1
VLGLLHLIFATPLFIHIVLTAFFFMGGAPRRYSANGDIDKAFDTTFADSIYVIVILFFLGQLLFFTNIFLSIIKALKQRTRN